MTYDSFDYDAVILEQKTEGISKCLTVGKQVHSLKLFIIFFFLD